MQDQGRNSQNISLSGDEKSRSFITIILRDLICAKNVNRLCTELEDSDDDDDDDDDTNNNNNNNNNVDNDSNNNNSLKF